MSLVTTVSVPPTHAVPSVPRIDGLPVAGARVLTSSESAKVTVRERSDAPSHFCAWTMLTVLSSSSFTAPVRVRVKTRSSSPAPMLG